MRSPRVGPWGPNVRVSGAVARGAPGVVVEPVSCGVMDSVPPRGGSRRSSTFALVGATGKGNVRRRRDGDVWGATSGGRVHLYGARVQPVLPPHRQIVTP